MSKIFEKNNSSKVAETSGDSQRSCDFVPEHVIVKPLGRIISDKGKRAKVYSTMSKEHVFIRPIDKEERESAKGTVIKLSELSPQVRRKFGC